MRQGGAREATEDFIAQHARTRAAAEKARAAADEKSAKGSATTVSE